METHCTICGKPLTCEISRWRGIGPCCIINQKQDLVGQATLFGARAKYDYRRVGDALLLYDLGGARSLTNDMDVVMREIAQVEGDLTHQKIMYRDSHGEWDGVIYQRGVVRFFYIGETDQNLALKVLDRKWKAAYSTS